jgi:hypothetical protein
MMKNNPKELERQLTLLRQVVAQKRIDAWDLGYQNVLSPGAIDEALDRMIESFGIQGTWKLILPMTKAPRM